jgi:hypothetical protein
MLANAALWAPSLARVFDTSLRYTVDKTTREVLFLPLPSELRQEVKPMVDVTVDRLARALGALMTLVLIQPWGFALAWNQLSVVSLILASVWFFMAVKAKQGYINAFRQGLARGDVEPDAVRLRPPTRRRSRRWSPSWPIPTRRASNTPSTSSSRSTSAT